MYMMYGMYDMYIMPIYVYVDVSFLIFQFIKQLSQPTIFS